MSGLKNGRLSSAISNITAKTLGMAALANLQLLAGKPAVAQQDDFLLEEIIVTATKREQNLQDVAISMSVMGAAELARTGSVRLDDVTAFVPNVTLRQEQTLAFGEFIIRGLSTASGTLGLSPGVGIYIDEVYMGRGSAGLTALADVERVEVLRGPQGTVFGRNTTMGAFNIITRQPTHEFGGEINTSIGNYDLQNVNGYVTGSLLAETLAGKLSLSSQRRDGYLDNSLGPDVNDVDSLSGRMQLLYTPSETMEFVWSLDATRDRATGNYQVGILDGVIDRDNLTDRVAIPDVGFEDRDLWGTSLRAEFELDGMALTAISAYRELEFEALSDQDGTAFTLISNLRREDHEQFSQEIRLASTSDGPMQWALGFYHYRENLSGTLDAVTGADGIWAALGLFDDLAGTLPTVMEPVLGLPFELADDTIIANGSDGSTESNAVFGSLTYSLDDRASVTAGLRYTKEKRDVRLVQDIFASDPTRTTAAIFLANFSGIPLIDDSEELEDDAFSADLSYSYGLSESVTLYAKVAHGFKSGGFNVGLTFAEPIELAFLNDWDPQMEFQPEKITSYELGWKASLMNDTLRVNGAVFYADFRDKQETIFVQNQGFSGDNAGVAKTQGLELETRWAASEGLVLSFNLGYTDAQYDEFEVDASTDNSGNRLPRAPLWNVSSALDYVFPVSDALQGTLRADVFYQSDYYADAVGTADFRTQEFALVNLRIGLRSADGVWSSSIWGKNLLDQERFLSASGASSQLDGERHYQPLNPPTYGVDVSYNF